jgi:hypothetical protein
VTGQAREALIEEARLAEIIGQADVERVLGAIVLMGVLAVQKSGKPIAQIE